MRSRFSIALMMMAAALALAGSSARAQIKPRVLVMVDTSGSMTEHFANNNTTGGDGSTRYTDALMTRDVAVDRNLGLYVGFETGAAICGPTAPSTNAGYDGINSRLYAAKTALANVVNGSGDVDWGLMRYTGTECAVTNQIVYSPNLLCFKNSQCFAGEVCNLATHSCTCTANAQCTGFVQAYGGATNVGVCNVGTGNCTCNANNQCGSGGCDIPAGKCACATDSDCGPYEFCFGGHCGVDANLCSFPNSLADYGATDAREAQSGVAQSCGNHSSNNAPYTGLPLSYYGSCGTTSVAASPACATPQTCYSDSECTVTPGRCSALPGSAAKACTCTGPADCPASYTCSAGNVCVYNLGCQSIGGEVKVDPGAVGAPAQLLGYVNGVEDRTAADPELRAVGATPLAGAARSAATWYKAKIVTDAQKQCRPYVLVQITDGFDTCEAGSTTAGPVAAAQAFVAATTPGARVLNKVYVVGLAFGTNPSPTLDAIAQAGGTGAARLANSPADIQAALADIVASSVLVEKCNGLDDDCDGSCDEPFPDVAISDPSCSNPRPAATCNNGALATTRCFATGTYVCSSDQLSETCNAVPSTAKGGASIVAGAPAGQMRVTGVIGMTAANVGDKIRISGAAGAGNNGTFTIVTVNGPFSVDVTNAAAVIPDANNGNLTWVDTRFEASPEVCNGIDDDCNGIVDDCPTGSAPGSCCRSMCPACAKPPYVETCNGCDDDCDGITDNHLTDTGNACGNNTGDCAPGVTACCAVDPSGGTACMSGATTDKLYCVGGNPGYPKPADLCDGTDDNCDGVTNGVPPLSCFPFPAPAMANVGICKSGTAACTTASLPAGDPGCPAGWPAGKTCPNPTPTHGACTGAIGPQPEVCNGLDDNCNGMVDEGLTDPWLNTACCSTGNNADCTNTGGGTRCKLGAYVCAAGAKSCGGSPVAKSPEVCNGIDDDCNGIIDDVPGIGAGCTGNGTNTVGRCTAKYVCNGAAPGSGPNGLTCQQVVGPQPEICNGIDDDCDGSADEPAAVAANDPRIGVACMIPMAPANQPPCKAGATVCVAGNVVCQGAVGPMPNQCNGVSTDCTGMPNSSGNCPSGYACVQGNCVQHCGTGEFPCPGGFVCQQSTQLCIPDACARLSCPQGDICTIGSDGMGTCVDPCVNVMCPTGYQCRGGVCLGCVTSGCPQGEVCKGAPPTCQTDVCANVLCPPDQYCNEQGDCAMVCATPCLRGQSCVNGMCVDDPCANVHCTSSQVCVAMSGVGVCVDNACGATGCAVGLACCGGLCQADPCLAIHCPSNTTCSVDSACNPTCQLGPGGAHDQIVGAGGGGFSCAMGGPSRGAAPPWSQLGLMAAALALGLRSRRRRAGAGSGPVDAGRAADGGAR